MYGGIPYVYPPTNNSSANWKSLVEEFPDIVSVNDLIDNYYTEFIVAFLSLLLAIKRERNEGTVFILKEPFFCSLFLFFDCDAKEKVELIYTKRKKEKHA